MRKQSYGLSGLINESFMVGRIEIMNKVVEILTQKDVLICITGMAGIGKIVFTQCLCNTDNVQEKFSLMIWVSVSAKLDLVRIMRAAVESVLKKSCDLMDLRVLRSTLEQLVLSSAGFLVVLDDFDIVDSEDWDILHAAFQFTSTPCRIIIVTRNSELALMVGATVVRLPFLSDEDCWNIIKQRPFFNNQLHNLEEVGIKIAEKCQGLPLVAKIVGDILHCLPDQEWHSVLKCNLWELPQFKKYIVPVLLVSYCSLPSPLKKCFSYCCLFPPGYNYEMQHIVLLWMAEGLIHPIKGRKQEDIGQEYFNELICRFLFNSPNEDAHNFNGFYQMHDFTHHVALLVSSSICLRIEDNKSYYSSDSVRHLSICHSNTGSMNLKKYPNCDKVRTFLWLCATDIGENVTDLFDNFLQLRVLDLQSGGITEVPNSVDKFRHLRYLNLSGYSISALPSSIAKSLLQTLILKNCTSLHCLPEDFSRLTMLRHLDFDVKQQLSRMPINFSMLVNIQTLNAFIVEAGTGYNIEELKDLTSLTGSICITGLEQVQSRESAETALLREKPGIKNLELEWRSSEDGDMQLQVLSGLQPHENLTKLLIDNYCGIIYPPWLSDRNCCMLRCVHLRRCHCSTLPPLGNLHFLEHLIIERMSSLTRVFHESVGIGEFPSLKSLVFTEMPRLLFWDIMMEVLSCFNFVI